MEQSTIRPLQVFLSHSSQDRVRLQELYERLMDSGIDVWISDEKLIPGQDWQNEIKNAVKTSDVVLLFLSNNALNRDGYFQKEIKLALEVAEKKPNGVIYIIPIRLEDCPVPDDVSRFHWVNYFEDRAYAQLIKALVAKAESLNLKLPAEGLLSIRNNLKDVKKKSVPISEAKVIVLGQGSVGKTSLIKRLLLNDFDSSERITEGVSISKWSVATDDKVSPIIDLNIWDMGGQEIMHSTHQFFLTKNSLYLLVLDSRITQEENRAEYWLKIIQSFGGDSPVIIVGNKTDQHPLNIDRTGLKKKYPNIVEFVETSAASGKGIEDLKSIIAQQVNNLPHVHDLLPETWFTLKKKIEKMGQVSDFIVQDKFIDLCNENDIIDEISQRTLIGFLHDLGVVLYFQDDPRLKDLGILNPQWITNGIYKIINSNELFHNKGVLSISMLDEMLDFPEYPRNKRIFIMDMLKKFELCYDIVPDRLFLVPDLLPKDEPYHLNFNGMPVFEYLYPILPLSIITRFIIRMNKKVEDNLIWRSGVVLNMGENRVLVKADIEDRKITIAIDGLDHTRRDALSAIRYQLDEIHSSIKNLEPQKRVPIPNAPNAEPIEYDYMLMLEREGQETLLVKDGNRLVKVNVRQILSGVESDATRIENRVTNIYISGDVKDTNFLAGDESEVKK